MITREKELAANVNSVQERIHAAAARSGRGKDEVSLIAVTKTYPAQDVEILHQLGISDFAENRDSEGREKAQVVSARWHFQGQIQSNKISSIAHWASVIHSLDNPRHVRMLANAVREPTILSVYVQVCLDPQPGRGGALPQDLSPLAELVVQAPQLRLEGLMAVAPLGEDPRSAFERLAQIHSVFRQEFPMAPSLSAGMSGDFETAIEYGATHVRIGSSILGSRPHLG